MEQINPVSSPPISPQIPVSPPVNSSSSNKTVLIVLVILFFIILSSSLTYFLVKSQSPAPTPIASPALVTKPTPTPDPTANWKTYTNTIRGIGLTFKYPQNLFYTEDPKFGADFFNIADKDKDPRTTVSKFEFTVNDLGRDFDTLYGLTDNTVDSSEKAGVNEKVIKLKNTMLGNQKAVQYATVSPNTYTLWTLVKVNNLFIEIFTNTEINSNFKPTYDQILSTFRFGELTTGKFTDQNQAMDTSTWETYTRSALGFSFKYPGDYFKYKQEGSQEVYLAPSQGNGGNGPKFLSPVDVWLNAEADSYAKDFTLDQYLASHPDLYANAQKITTTIGGLSGYKVTYDYPAVAGNVRIYNYEGLALGSKNFFKITLSAWDQTSLQKNQTMFDQILSTFRFD